MTSNQVPHESGPADITQPAIPVVEQIELAPTGSIDLTQRQRIGQWIGNTRPMQWFMNTRPGKLAGVGAEDFREGSLGQKVGLLATAAFVAYEWGPGNEVVTPLIGGQVLAHTNGLASVIATSAIAGGFTAAEQIASGSTAAYTGSTFPRLAKTTFELYNESQEDREPWKETSLGKRWGYAFGLGSTFSVTREAVVTGEADQSHLTRTAVSSAALTSSTVAAVGAAAGALKLVPKDAPEVVTKLTDGSLAVLESPFTWLGLATYYIASPALRRRLARNKNTTAVPIETSVNEKDG